MGERLLVVDDDADLVEFLEDCQFDVSAADSAEGALDLIARMASCVSSLVSGCIDIFSAFDFLT